MTKPLRRTPALGLALACALCLGAKAAWGQGPAAAPAPVSATVPAPAAPVVPVQAAVPAPAVVQAPAAVSAPAAAPAAAPASVPVQSLSQAPRGESLVVTLKDGQTARLSLLDYDRFFLSASNAKGTRFDIPWTEVATVDGPNATDVAMMRAHLDSGPVAVATRIEARDPSEALHRALWPGVLVHGSGLRYVGDQGSFVGLAGAEVFGVILGAFGAYLEYYPSYTNTQDPTVAAPKILIGAGAACFLGTWAWDLAFSHYAALKLDADKGLALEPAQRGEGLQLSYRY